MLGQPAKRRGLRRRGAPGWFLRTRRYTPDLRAFARQLGHAAHFQTTGTPATMTVFAFANCAETSATIAFFLSRSRPRSSLHLSKPPVAQDLRAPTATLHSGKSCMGFAICVGRKDCSKHFVPPIEPRRFLRSLINPPHAVKAVRWPKVLSSISNAAPSRRRQSSPRPPARPVHGRGHRHLAQVESLHVGRPSTC